MEGEHAAIDMFWPVTIAPVPLLSVVVPIYNVGSYLAPCLDSLLAGTLQDLEIICIDDGSTDGSGELADLYAVKDDRLRVLHVENGGLGRARNIGSDEATGRYLAFADSDDRIPKNAYELLCGSMEETGSDLATGRVRRFNDTRSYLSGLHTRAIPSAARRTHISRMPSLVYDTTAWNKAYRRGFWDEHHLRFPEGVVYEDIPVTVPAHVLAEAVDVRPGDLTGAGPGAQGDPQALAALGWRRGDDLRGDVPAAGAPVLRRSGIPRAAGR